MGGQSPEVAVQGGMSWWVVGSGGGGRGLRCRCTTPSPHQVQAGCASPLPLLGTQQGCGGGGGRGRAWVLRRQVGWACHGGWVGSGGGGRGAVAVRGLSLLPLCGARLPSFVTITCQPCCSVCSLAQLCACWAGCGGAVVPC